MGLGSGELLGGLGGALIGSQYDQQNKYRQYCDAKQQAQAQHNFRNPFIGSTCTMAYGTQAYFGPSMVQASCAHFGDQEAFFGNPHRGFMQETEEEKAERLKKHKKAENKALLLMQNLIGSEQCDVYRATHRVILHPNKWFWVIGNVFKSFCEDDPFVSKPDVIRIDNTKKLHFTSFCVAQRGGDPTPYTDKVVSFASHLMANEKAFVKMGNRIREDSFDEMPKCAVMK